MASIAYTALREFEATGYAKAGTDISVAGADDSFNSAGTNLAGLLTGQWLLSAGYANGANNGWFHINGNSTSAKITQDTTTALVTEAVGPSVTLTGYKRGLGQQYTMDFDLEGGNRSRKVKRSTHQPIGGGQPETVFYRTEKFVDLSALVAEATLAQWLEFLGSVESGETFTFDRYGTIAAPIEPKVAILASEDLTEERVIPMYPGRYRIAVKVRLLT